MSAPVIERIVAYCVNVVMSMTSSTAQEACATVGFITVSAKVTSVEKLEANPAMSKTSDRSIQHDGRTDRHLISIQCHRRSCSTMHTTQQLLR